MRQTVHALLVFAVAAGCGKKSEPHGEPLNTGAPAITTAPKSPTPTPPATSASAAPPTSAPALLPSAEVRLREVDIATISGKATFDEALAYAKPKIEDATTDWDRGTYLLGEWLSEHGKWKTIADLPETSRLKISKDSEGETGKRFCEFGTVTTIKAMKTDGPKMFWGIIAPNEVHATVFMAVGDTGNIVDGSQARICGAATGIYRLTLKSGEPLPSPKLVGMFDLPTNRKR